MDYKNMQIEHYLKIIDEIEKIRTKNNVNWMDVLRLAFMHAPDEWISRPLVIATFFTGAFHYLLHEL